MKAYLELEASAPCCERKKGNIDYEESAEGGLVPDTVNVVNSVLGTWYRTQYMYRIWYSVLGTVHSKCIELGTRYYLVPDTVNVSNSVLGTRYRIQ